MPIFTEDACYALVLYRFAFKKVPFMFVARCTFELVVRWKAKICYKHCLLAILPLTISLYHALMRMVNALAIFVISTQRVCSSKTEAVKTRLALTPERDGVSQQPGLNCPNPSHLQSTLENISSILSIASRTTTFSINKLRHAYLKIDACRLILAM